MHSETIEESVEEEETGIKNVRSGVSMSSLSSSELCLVNENENISVSFVLEENTRIDKRVIVLYYIDSGSRE